MKQSSACLELIVINRVSQVRIAAEINLGAHSAENFAGFFHSLKWDVRIGIAAAEEHRSACERGGVISGRPGRTDQATAQAEYRAVSPGVSCGKFQRQTCSLRKARKHNALAGNLSSEEISDERFDAAKCGVEVRLVRFQRSEKRLRIPGVSGGLRSDRCETIEANVIVQREDAVG